MTIGPGGIGGAGGAGGAGGPDGPDGPDDVDGPEGADAADAADGAGTASAIAPGQLEALAAEIAAHKLTAQEAIEQMIDRAGVGLAPQDRAELRELLVDLVENDPYLQSLARQV